MKAKYTTGGKTKEQTIYELEKEAEENGYDTEYERLEYLRDCYLADESGFKGNFSEWLDGMYA